MTSGRSRNLYKWRLKSYGTSRASPSSPMSTKLVEAKGGFPLTRKRYRGLSLPVLPLDPPICVMCDETLSQTGLGTICSTNCSLSTITDRYNNRLCLGLLQMHSHRCVKWPSVIKLRLICDKGLCHSGL